LNWPAGLVALVPVAAINSRAGQAEHARDAPEIVRHGRQLRLRGVKIDGKVDRAGAQPQLASLSGRRLGVGGALGRPAERAAGTLLEHDHDADAGAKKILNLVGGQVLGTAGRGHIPGDEAQAVSGGRCGRHGAV